MKKASIKNWSKVVLQIGPCMLRNIIGPVFNTAFWSLLEFLLLFENIFLPAERRGFERKSQNKKNLNQLLTQ